MKKGKLLIVLLSISIGCIAPTVQSKPVNKKVTTSHKKTNKNKAVPARKITEKDIAECTSLINRVAQKEITKISVPVPVAANNTKIAEHLQKPADTQLFASDDPKAIAHLTGKTVGLVPPPAIKLSEPSIHIMPAAKLTAPPVVNPVTATSKPVAKPTALTTPKHIDQPIKPDNAKAVTPTTIKTAKYPTPKSTAKSPATTVVKPKTAAQPHIELFAPNTPDLDHLEGKSADLANLQPPTPAKVSAVDHQKNKKLTNKKKLDTASVTKTDAKKR